MSTPYAISPTRSTHSGMTSTSTASHAASRLRQQWSKYQHTLSHVCRSGDYSANTTRNYDGNASFNGSMMEYGNMDQLGADASLNLNTTFPATTLTAPPLLKTRHDGVQYNQYSDNQYGYEQFTSQPPAAPSLPVPSAPSPLAPVPEPLAPVPHHIYPPLSPARSEKGSMPPPAPHPYPSVRKETTTAIEEVATTGTVAPSLPTAQISAPSVQIAFEATSVTKFTPSMLAHLTSEEKNDIIITLQIENAKMNEAYDDLKEWAKEEVTQTVETAGLACDDAYEQIAGYKSQAETATQQLNEALRKLELAHRREMLFRGGREADEEGKEGGL